MNEESVIVAEDLTKKFNESLLAVGHVGFTVKEGENFGFICPNGSGKTTSMNMLMTVLKPTEGNATVSDHDIEKQTSEVRNCIEAVPQELRQTKTSQGLRTCSSAQISMEYRKSRRGKERVSFLSLWNSRSLKTRESIHTQVA